MRRVKLPPHLQEYKLCLCNDLSKAAAVRQGLFSTIVFTFEPERKLLQVKELEDALQAKDAKVQSLEQQASPLSACLTRPEY